MPHVPVHFIPAISFFLLNFARTYQNQYLKKQIHFDSVRSSGYILMYTFARPILSSFVYTFDIYGGFFFLQNVLK